MFRLIWAASIHTHTVLRWAPTNLLLNRIRTRRGLKWGIPVMLLAGPYLLAASASTQILKNGGPGWLNLLVSLFIWNAMKFIIIGPVSLVLLVRIHIQEIAERRRAGQRREAAKRRSTALLAKRPHLYSLADGGPATSVTPDPGA